MAEEEAAQKAEEEAETFLGPLPPDVIAEAEEAGADKPTAEVLRICKCDSYYTLAAVFKCVLLSLQEPTLS